MGSPGTQLPASVRPSHLEQLLLCLILSFPCIHLEPCHLRSRFSLKILSPLTFPSQSPVLVSLGFDVKMPQTMWLKQQTSIVSLLQRPEVPNQGVGSAGPFGHTWGRIWSVSRLLVAPGSPWFVGCILPIPSHHLSSVHGCI